MIELIRELFRSGQLETNRFLSQYSPDFGHSNFNFHFQYTFVIHFSPYYSKSSLGNPISQSIELSIHNLESLGNGNLPTPYG